MSGQVSKPNHIFDRDREWKTLVRFATSESGDVRLGIVSGRRRQGKTYLLDAAATTFGGFFFAATDSTETESLASFGRALAGYGGGRYAFADWDEAVQRLFGVVSGGLIIIDEFPYLIERQPRAAVPDPARARSPGIRPAEPGADGAGRVGHVGHGAPARRKRAAARPGQHGNDHPAVRLPGRGEVLGHQRPWPGSARPLGRGRNARLPPRVRDGRRPASLADFDPWVLRTVLNPQLPLFRSSAKPVTCWRRKPTSATRPATMPFSILGSGGRAALRDHLPRLGAVGAQGGRVRGRHIRRSAGGGNRRCRGRSVSPQPDPG